MILLQMSEKELLTELIRDQQKVTEDRHIHFSCLVMLMKKICS